MDIAILNGPNLNLLGSRQPGIYGNQSMQDLLESLKQEFDDSLYYFETNDEGQLISALHDYDRKADGIVLNPGGLTHTSVSLLDALKAISVPVVEVHVSHVMARESYRKRSLISAACRGSVSGFGMNSYKLGIIALYDLLLKPSEGRDEKVL